MDVKEIKELMVALETSSLHKLHYKKGEKELLLEKGVFNQAITPPLVLESSYPHLITNKQATPPSSPSGKNEKTLKKFSVTAPLVGIFYQANNSESEPFVTVGSQVKAGDTLCIIEAMKILNEIKATTSGRVVAIHVNNGDLVSYDQVLMEIGE